MLQNQKQGICNRAYLLYNGGWTTDCHEIPNTYLGAKKFVFFMGGFKSLQFPVESSVDDGHRSSQCCGDLITHQSFRTQVDSQNTIAQVGLEFRGTCSVYVWYTVHVHQNWTA